MPSATTKAKRSKSYELIHTLPHDTSCFTQGLEYYNGLLYESTGMTGRSCLQIVHPDTGNVLKRVYIDKTLFGEGITVVNDRVYMLTWKNKKMLIFDAISLELIGTNTFTTHSRQGWGIISDGTYLIMSDGSDTLNYFEFPQVEMGGTELKKVKEVKVVDKGNPVRSVNELEYIDGFIYANIWYVDKLIKIHPTSGNIVKTFNFRNLYPKRSRSRSADCFNGIAFNSTDRSVMLTGKYWDKYYRVNLMEL
eukprot:CAMPEP_0114436896 /NCGR_PEP_ID=MMETSP0103-20121206/13709_1 /TAXON_ID=37642 ORGANISM="Paraphysomonas imperforata, Strain PA2" /NCGR_SAMPLE_ID=MMETSP0103 /ASSEMBLY_ACC=CAM_ASM_000201 /LENGTH=249 /DNA_ID=CAMNT_0001607221 /DNA_START=71 /DNA_END=817 /DNA_ORIENTATION=-